MVSGTIVSSRVITSNAVFISNSLLMLANSLTEILSQRSGPLRTIIIIPSNPIKNFLTQHLTNSLGGCFGVRFLTLPQAIEHFLKLSYSDTFAFPSFSKLSLHIESLLLNPEDALLPLITYLGSDKQKISSLSRELAHVFLHYGVYGGKALKKWEKDEGYWQTLWHQIAKTWDFPQHILEKKPEPKFPINLILFNLHHIPPLYKTFLDTLSSFWQTFHFFRSPTPLYWGDLLSDRALAKTDLSFQNRNISASKRSDFEHLASDTNALLANFGTLGKSTFLWLAEKETQELFVPPEESSTLSQIQSDIFSMLPSRALEKDHSLEIHEASSIFQEITLLLENIKTTLGTGQILPEEILVLASDLNCYFPYIQFVFENKESPLGYSISDLTALPHNHVLKTIDLFFTLVESRFEAETIKDLLLSEPIAKKQNFSSEEFSLLSQIIEDMNIEWGFDQEMKKEILNIDSISQRGSWKFAFDHLLESLAFSSSFEISKFELLGNLISFLETLFTDLRKLKKREETLANWILILDELLQKYFVESEELQFVLKEIHSFGFLAQQVTSLFSFPSIHALLKEIFMKKTFDKYVSKKPVIQFAGLSDGSSLETKVIYLLGMDEDSFPRKRLVRSLNHLKGDPDCDHQPENSEKDRFFFLEALLSAKEKLVISYTGVSSSDGKPLAPSLCVQDLIHNFSSNPVQKHSAINFYPKPKQLPPLKIIVEPAQTLIIDIRHLLELVRHPIRFYCNRILGIFLDKAPEKDSKEFFLSYLDKAQMFDSLLMKDEDELIELWEKKNILPTALLEAPAKKELLKEFQEIQKGLITFGLTKKDFFSLHLDPLCKEPISLDANRFIHPTIQSTLPDGTPFTLFGKLPSLTKQGVYIHKNYSLAEVWKHLPYIAILKELSSYSPPTLLFGKDLIAKTPSFPLVSLVEYYREATQSISPLLPDQIEKFIKKKEFSPSSFFEDPYLSFLQPDLSKNWEAFPCKNLIV